MIQTITQYTQDLERLEGVIRKNLTAFYEVGRALMEIRDKGLYRDVKGYETFEAYCKAEWDFARRTAYQYIDAAKTMENVRNCAQIEILPDHESQTRPLAHLEPDQQREVWKKAVDTAPDGKVTAAVMENVNHGLQAPTNERQCRSLAHLEPDQQREVWKKAVETAPDGKVTAAHVSKIAKEITDGGTEPELHKSVEPQQIATSAMQFATMAITNLQRIREDDPKKKEALIRVIKWIQQQLGE